MAVNDNVQQQAELYYELLAQGLPAQEAYDQAFPEGVPPEMTEEDMMREQAKAEQKYGLAQIGGTIGGALIGRELMKRTEGLTGAIGDRISQAGDYVYDQVADAGQGLYDALIGEAAEQTGEQLVTTGLEQGAQEFTGAGSLAYGQGQDAATGALESWGASGTAGGAASSTAQPAFTGAGSLAS